MLYRAAKAAILDGRIYHRIGDDPQEMFNAVMIVAMAALALGLGVGSASASNLQSSPSQLTMALMASTKLTMWIYWTGIVYLIGTKALGGEAGFRTLLRNLGLTFGPGVLAAFAQVPAVGPIFLSLSFVWMFPAGLVAVNESEGFGWVKAGIANIIGWTAAVTIQLMLMNWIAGPPPSG